MQAHPIPDLAVEPRGQIDKVRSGRDHVTKKVVSRSRTDERDLRVRTPDKRRDDRAPVRVSPERSSKTRETVIVQKSENGRTPVRVEKSRKSSHDERRGWPSASSLAAWSPESRWASSWIAPPKR